MRWQDSRVARSDPRSVIHHSNFPFRHEPSNRTPPSTSRSPLRAKLPEALNSNPHVPARPCIFAFRQSGAPIPWGIGLQPAGGVVKEAIHDFNTLVLWIIIAISIFVLGLLGYVVWRFRASANPVPSRTSHHTMLEVAWTVVPVLILVGIAIPSITLLRDQYSPPKADVTVKVIGNQWYWTYQYPDNGDFEIVSNMLKEKGDVKAGDRFRTDEDDRVQVAHDAHALVSAAGMLGFTRLSRLCREIEAAAHGDGDLGADCNHSYNDTCSLPFRARATAYSILTVLLSIMAWEAKHLTRSLFNMYPEEDSSTFSIFNTLLKNRFLFWAVCAGLCTPFPIVYIPVINRVVFRHAPLSWEWGLVFGSVVIFVALIESWKAVKRRSLKKRAVARQLAGGSGSGSVEGDDKSSIA